MVPGTETPGGSPPAGDTAAAPVGRPQGCTTTISQPRINSVLRSTSRILGVDPPPTSSVPSQELVTGRTYGRECHFTDDGSLAFVDDFVPGPAGPGAPAGEPVALAPSVEVLAQQAYAEVPLALPVPHTSPPADVPQLVGLPVWLWLDDASWSTFDASASVAGVTVTVVATPQSASWDMGDGATVTCSGPGTPWTGDTSARTSCSHTYQHVSDRQPGGRYQASVTLTWSVSWSATTGETGTLPDASRRTSFELDVRQRQGVITHGG